MTDPLTGCKHDRITAWRDEDGTIAVWACAECSRRFYPACPICVSVGHRNVAHPDVARAAIKENR